MEKYGSIKKAVDDELISFYNLELQMMAMERVDDLTPAVVSMEISQIAIQQLIELAEYVKKNGKSEATQKRMTRCMRLLDLSCKLNTLTGDLNTMKLNNKELARTVGMLRIKNAELIKQLEGVKKSFDEL